MTSTKVEFSGKELPKAIDVMNDGVLLYSDQNVMKFGFDGLQKYIKYYPAPRQPALMRALLLAEAVRAAYIGAAASALSSVQPGIQPNNQTTDPTTRAVSQQMSQGLGQLSDAGFAYSSAAMKEFKARYKASQNTPRLCNDDDNAGEEGQPTYSG